MKCYALRLDGQELQWEHAKPFFVSESIAQLTGPSVGSVELPLSIDWTPSNTFDLSNPMRVRTMYAKVLMEAPDEQSISKFVNGNLLIREWTRLRLPSYVRSAWEQKHPELRQC